MSNSPMLSIVIPIFNVEKYLSKCIESVLIQTYDDFELILVDDGSPDNCGRICDDYAKKDNRIIVIHKENGGVSSARNAGLDIAKGKYIGFVDPDDYIDKDMYYDMIMSAEKNNADIVCCNWFVDDNGNIYSHKTDASVLEIMNKEQFVCELFKIPRTVGGSCCTKIFLKKNIKNKFNETLDICEDNMFLFENSKNINKVLFVDKCLYNLYQRNTSATRANVDETLYKSILVRYSIFNNFKNHSKICYEQIQYDLIDSCLQYQLKKNIDIKKAKYIYKLYKEQVISCLFFFNSRISTKNKIIYLKYVLTLGRKM